MQGLGLYFQTVKFLNGCLANFKINKRSHVERSNLVTTIKNKNLEDKGSKLMYIKWQL